MSAASARGLFRAMGKTARPVRLALGDDDGAVVEALPREADDFYPTPPEPVLAFCAAEKAALDRFPLIWEPAAGDGAMARALGSCGRATVLSDIVDRGCGAEIVDFLAVTRARAPAIVTNPPFNLCNWRDGRARWITHALEALDVPYMALLLPWSWPGAGGLSALWAKHPPARVHLMRWKIDFTGQGAPPSHHGWFVWDRAAPPGTQLLMMDRVDARQGGLFDPEDVGARVKPEHDDMGAA